MGFLKFYLWHITESNQTASASATMVTRRGWHVLYFCTFWNPDDYHTDTSCVLTRINEGQVNDLADLVTCVSTFCIPAETNTSSTVRKVLLNAVNQQGNTDYGVLFLCLKDHVDYWDKNGSRLNRWWRLEFFCHYFKIFSNIFIKLLWL